MVQVVRNISVRPDTFALNVTPLDWVDAKLLAAGVAEAFAVPTQGGKPARFVVFSSTDNFYARYNAATSGTAATVPGDTSDGTACELNPTIRELKGVLEISVISPGTPIITARYYF